MMVTSLVPGEVLQAMIEAAERAPRAPIVEVGVYKGGSAFHLAGIAASRQIPIHLFDTFTGMPHAEIIDKHPVGDFADTCVMAVQRLVPNAICHPGIFPATLPADLTGIGFLHCDVDQYVSTRDVIQHLWPRMVPGGIAWFDDCELEPALQAIHENIPLDLLRPAPQGRLYAVKPS
jgi:O-methyltransferase